MTNSPDKTVPPEASPNTRTARQRLSAPGVRSIVVQRGSMIQRNGWIRALLFESRPEAHRTSRGGRSDDTNVPGKRRSLARFYSTKSKSNLVAVTTHLHECIHPIAKVWSDIADHQVGPFIRE